MKVPVKKRNIVFDFDGVIHSYVSGDWKGPAVIEGEPVQGIGDAIKDLRSKGYDVVVVSTRCADAEGYNAVVQWLRKHNIVVDLVAATKPPALVYVDDRGLTFDGDASNLVKKIVKFRPWWMDK